VEHIRIRNCVYKRGNGVLTLAARPDRSRCGGGELQDHRQVEIATVKLRPDTPQLYEDINPQHHTEGTALRRRDAAMVAVCESTGATPPQSVVRNLNSSHQG